MSDSHAVLRAALRRLAAGPVESSETKSPEWMQAVEHSGRLASTDAVFVVCGRDSLPQRERARAGRAPPVPRCGRRRRGWIDASSAAPWSARMACQRAGSAPPATAAEVSFYTSSYKTPNAGVLMRDAGTQVVKEEEEEEDDEEDEQEQEQEDDGQE